MQQKTRNGPLDILISDLINKQKIGRSVSTRSPLVKRNTSNCKMQSTDASEGMMDRDDSSRSIKTREEKIKQAMGRMADTVLKKSNAAEKEFEVRLLQQANAADKKAEEAEAAKKKAALQREISRKQTLDHQMKEKRD